MRNVISFVQKEILLTRKSINEKIVRYLDYLYEILDEQNQSIDRKYWNDILEEIKTLRHNYINRKLELNNERIKELTNKINNRVDDWNNR